MVKKIFPEDWKKVKIGEHFDFKNGLNKAKEFFGKGTPIVNYMDVYPHPAIHAKNIHGKVTVSNDELRAFEVRKGDVLFTRTSETIEEIGLSSTVMDDVEKTVFSGFLLRGRPKTKLFESKFKRYCFRSNAVRKQIISTSSQTTRALTNGRLLSKVSILVPINPKEQLEIAEALSNIEEFIDHLELLIEKKKNIKQGAIQELLTGKRRLEGFNGKWKETSLEKIGTFAKGRGIKKTDVLDTGLPCIRYGEIYTKYNVYVKEPLSHISVDVARQSQQIKNGDLLFTGSGETAEEIGKCIVYLGDENCYAGGDIIIFSPIGNEALFLAFLLNSDSVNKQKSSMAQGDMIVHIYSSALKKIKISIPEFPEQSAITKILSDMDSEIKELEKNRDKYIMIKNGMMQKLLTGEIRLK